MSQKWLTVSWKPAEEKAAVWKLAIIWNLSVGYLLRRTREVKKLWEKAVLTEVSDNREVTLKLYYWREVREKPIIEILLLFKRSPSIPSWLAENTILFWNKLRRENGIVNVEEKWNVKKSWKRSGGGGSAWTGARKLKIRRRKAKGSLKARKPALKRTAKTLKAARRHLKARRSLYTGSAATSAAESSRKQSVAGAAAAAAERRLGAKASAK